jgi:hypothetical protein
MMIPSGQFFATPVLLLSPGQADSSPHQDYQPLNLPGDNLSMISKQTPFLGVNTVTATMESLPPVIGPSLCLPLAKDKYSTLPRKKEGGGA